MGLTGKYDFKGIQRLGAAGLSAVLSTTAWGAALLKFGLKVPIEIGAEWASNWLANKGLVILNIGAIYVNGEFDQSAFDNAMENGLSRVEAGGLTEAQKKAIDDEVIKAFRRFAPVTRPS